MSVPYFTPAEIQIDGREALTLYVWGDRLVNHWFCRTCGIYTFHSATRSVPALRKRYEAEVARVIRDVWNVPALLARIDQASKVIHRAPKLEGADATDVVTFDKYLQRTKDYVTNRKTYVQAHLR